MSMQQPPNWGPGYGAPPPSHGYPPPHHGQGQQGYPPPKKGMSTGLILLIVLGGLFGSCMMCGAIGAIGKDKDGASTSSSTGATHAAASPSAQAARLAAEQKAAEEAKAAKEKNAADTFPQKSTEIAAALKKATAAADAAKWAQAETDLTSAEADLSAFRGTSVADTKPFQELDAKASTQRKRIAPQVEKLAKAAAAAADEKELKASAVSVTSTELFNAYQANEVAADERYKGRKLLVTGTVASIDKGAFGGLHLRLATPNEFMSTMCRMESSEKADLLQLNKGETVRVLCKGHGMVMGSPSLGDCTFR